MSDSVTQWLEQLGLGEYASSFAENHIDSWNLLELTSDDLKELGVGSLGHRKTILRAIKALDSEEVASSATPTSRSEAERRQLTVMFCDLVGSTELSQQLDPEDLREVNRSYQDACKSAIERYEGYVARYMGDGVLAYFGYPKAHEDDAERAIHAGLGVVDSVANINTDIQAIDLSVRVGIATGPVVVGDLIGEGASQESAVVGETPNLAARIQALAAPNTVVVGPGTFRLAGARFDCEDLGAHEMKGITAAVRVWRMKAVAELTSRFSATRRGVQTPLIGRDEELDILTRRWHHTRDAEGQVVLLSGESGIGKSRLCETLRQQINDEPNAVVRIQCSPFHSASALYPIITHMERITGFESTDSPTSKLEKLESFVQRLYAALGDNKVPLMAGLLSVPTGDRYPDFTMDEEQQKAHVLPLLLEHFETLQKSGPVLALVEDVHWADPSTQEFLDLLVDGVEPWRLLVLITSRPEFTAPWVGNAQVSLMALNRLSRRHSRRLVKEAAGAYGLSAEMEKEIVARTDGVPLFIEELTETVVSTSDTAGAGLASTAAIPSTLQDSLMARFDSLAAGKIVAQTGAAIGREFSHELIKVVWERDQTELERGLDEVVSSG